VLTVCMACASFGSMQRDMSPSQSCGSNTLDQGPSRMRALPSDACQAVKARLRRCLCGGGWRERGRVGVRVGWVAGEGEGWGEGEDRGVVLQQADPMSQQVSRQEVGHTDPATTLQLQVPSAWL